MDDNNEIQAEVEMVFNKDLGYRENEYQDYMYDDGTFVPAGTRIGIETAEELVLDKGINYATYGRE